jgi:hypothetical protein
MHPVLQNKNFIKQVHMIAVATKYIQMFKKLRKNMLMGCAWIKMVSYQKMLSNWTHGYVWQETERY